MSKSSAQSKAAKQPAQDKKKTPKANATKRVTVDIVTGKEAVSVYFDPSKCVDCDKNDYDWLGNHMYSPAQVVKDDNGLVSVCLSSGEIFKMKEVRKVTDNDDEGVDDILKLRDFSEMSLIHTLRVRYFRDEIYTMVGPILISLNPYKRIKDIYSDAAMVEYHTRKQGDLPPHLFVLAEATYAALMNSKAAVKARDQSIIISGESGAGKTEATKVIMTFLTRITGMDAVASDANPSHAIDSAVHVNVGELEQRVLNTNPILEAFGNARTLRNDNSSRFGKFIKIQFSKAGRIVGATIEKYLLEKTRIIHQTPGERNYHIFYQLLRGASDELLAQTELRRDISSYAYLCSLDAASANIPNVNDQEEFVSTQRCMSSVGVEESVQVNIFKLISGVLHLGNILFLEDDTEEQVGGVTPDTLSQLEAAARLLGFSSADLVTSMTKQNMYVGGNTIVKVQTHSQAMDKRSSFAKCIYSMLFSWLVDKINLTIASADKIPWGFIGLLDIYGFENFDGVNSFEQLLINYANEKMQNHFNKHIFQIEQAEYAAESIDWSYISFSDNLPCLDLIDAKPNGKTGIFQTLDDSTGSGRVDVNANFLATLNQLWSGSSSESARHTNYVAPRFNSDQRFGILHYAGEVFYETAGFAEKNRDSMNNDMKELMSKSTNELLRAMAEETLKQEAAVNASNAVSAVATSATSKANKKPSVGGKSVNRTNSFVTSKLKEDSISKQFTASLRQLFETLETTEPHFVRCVKPNVYKRADFLNANETLLQLKYAGMLETIRIRQQGYALRLTHKEFFHTYSCLVPTSSNLKGLVDSLSKILSVSHEAWQVGTTKLFLRRDMSEKLDRLLTLRWHTSARKIQHRWRHILRKRAAIKLQALTRALLGKKRYQRMCRHIVKLQTVYRAFRHTKSYRVTKKAISNIQRVMMGRMARVLARKLRNPFNRMTYQELTAALKTAESDLKIAFENKDFETCATLEVTIGDIRAARAKLPLPEVVPTSRKEVELYVLEMRFAIEYTLEVQDYASIPALEDRKRKIESYRVTFPTAEEIQAELSGVKEVLAAAMAKKEFRRCGELQEKVTALEKKLNEVSGGQLGLKSVEDLKTERFTLETKISEALVAKDFDLCGNIQSELDDVVAALTRVDVSPEEAAQRLEEVQYEMKVSRETREFLRMAELQEHLDLLQQIIADAAAAAAAAKVQAEVVVEVVPEIVVVDPHAHKTYEEITAEIDALAAELTAAVSKKEYARCEEIEKTVQQLQEARTKLPVPEPVYTRAQLETMVKEKSAEIDAALAAKKYQLCDQLNAELEVLKAKLDAIPTAASVETKIFALQDRLKELIATKQYGKCGEVEAEIEALTPLYERLLAEEPKMSKADRRKSNLLPRPAVKVSGAPVKATVVKDKASVKAASVKAPSVAPSVLTVSSVNTQKTKTKSTGKPQHDRSVAKLRPKAPITASDSDNIFEVAVKMAASRADAALLLDEDGALAGIITDNDVTRRVVSQFVNPAEGSVKDVMTKGPKCVRNEDSALDALEMMVDNRFRHLPVLDKDGVVVGLLDIAKCLYDAISVLEKVQGDDSKENGGGNGAALASVMGAAMKSAAGGRGNNKAQMQAMQLLMEQMFGGSVPTLRTIIGKDALPSVRHTINVREASCLMTKHRKGLLVLDDEEELVGIITPKDILMRVLAQNKSPDLTAVSSVMTPNPDCVSPDLTLIDALREMHDHKYLHLPVRDDDGGILGLVDVMELVCSTAGGNGGKGWRDFFSGAMNTRGDDQSDTASRHSSVLSLPPKPVPIRAKYLDQKPHHDTSSDVFSISYDAKGALPQDFYSEFDFKITDAQGHLHKVKSSATSLSALKVAIGEKVSIPVEALLLKYRDEETDEVVLSSDASLKDAVEFARSSGQLALKLTATVVPVPAAADKKTEITSTSGAAGSKESNNTMLFVGGGVALVAAIGAALFVFTRSKK